MPAALPALVGAAAGWAAASAAAGTVLTLAAAMGTTAFLVGSTIGALVVGQLQARHQQRKAESASRAAYEAAQTDRAVMVRGSTEPRRVVYGENVVSGPITFIESIGGSGGHEHYKDFLHMVVTLATHELTSIDEIIVNDHQVVAWKDGIGAHDPKFAKGLDDDGKDSPKLAAKYRRQLESFTFSAEDNEHTLRYRVDDSEDFTVEWDTGEMYWVSPEAGGLLGEYRPKMEPVLESAYRREGKTVTLVDDAYRGKKLVFKYTANTDRASTKSDWYADEIEYKLQVRRYVGAPGQQADQILMDAFPGKWTEDHRGEGIAYLACLLHYDQDIYPTGIPQIKALVKGKKCFDPRTNRSEYTDNSALIAADWLMNEYGFRCDHDEIDWDSVSAAANICDEMVELGPDFGGGSQKRYTCHGVISAEGDRKSALADICSTMAGGAVFSQGKWRVYAGAYRTPTLTLTEDDITDVASVNVVSRMPRSELFNAVRGRYFLPAPQSGEAEFPPMANPTYAAEDGDVIYTELNLPFVNDVYRAQRLAKITLERSRQAIVINAGFNYRAYQLSPFDTVRLTMPRFGWVNKVFKVAERKFSPDAAVQLSLVEEAPEVYQWNNGDATSHDTAPNTNLPNPFFVVPPQDLTVESGERWMQANEDGTITHRLRISWRGSPDIGVVQGGTVELEYRREDEPSSWVSLRVGGGEIETFASPVVANKEYIVRARFVNGLGVRSQWTYSNHVAGGKTSFDFKPMALQAEGDIFAINLRWTLPHGVKDIGYTEVYYSRTANFADAVPLGAFAFPQNTHSLMGLGPGEAFYFWARLIDKVGNEGPFYPEGAGVFASASADSEKILDYLLDKITKTQLAKELLDEIEDASEVADRAHQSADEALQRAEQAKQNAEDALGRANGVVDRILEAEGDIETVREKADAAVNRAALAVERLKDVLDDIEVAKLMTAAERYIREDEDNVVARKVEDLRVEVDENISAQITAVQEAIANAEEAVAYQFELMQAKVAENQAQISSEKAARADAIAAEAQRTDLLLVQVGEDFTAAILEERQARTSAQESLAEDLSVLSTRTGKNEAAVIAESKARTDAISAEASRTDTLVANLGKDFNAAIQDERQARTTVEEATAELIQTLTVRTGANESAISQESKARTTAISAEASRTDALVASMGEDFTAAITEERNARTKAEESFTETLSVLTTRTEDNEAAVVDERKARTDAISAEASRTDALIAELGEDFNATIVEERTARTNAEESVARQLESLETRTGKNEAAVAEETKARTTAMEAEAQRVETLVTNLGDEVHGRITTVEQSRSTFEQSLNTRLEGMTSEYRGIRSDLTTESTTRANAVSSLSQRITTAQTTADSGASAAATAKTLAETVGDKIRAANTLQVQLRQDGKKYLAGIGVGIEADGKTGQVQSDIVMMANRLSLITTTNGALQTPFVIDGANVYLADTFMKSATVTEKVQSSNYQHNVQGFKLNSDGTGQIGGVQIGADYLQSTNYNGSNGWKLQRNGSAHFNNISLRGDISGGAYTTYAWPSSGSGFHLSQYGLLIGNHSAGKYFQVEGTGNIYAPGFQVVDGTLTINQANVINTLNIAGDAVTVPRGNSTPGGPIPTSTSEFLSLPQFDPGGGAVIVMFSGSATLNSVPDGVASSAVTISIRRNGQVIWDAYYAINGGVSLSAMYLDYPGGPATYKLYVNRDGTASKFEDVTLVALGCKR